MDHPYLRYVQQSMSEADFIFYNLPSGCVGSNRLLLKRKNLHQLYTSVLFIKLKFHSLITY